MARVSDCFQREVTISSLTGAF